MKRITTFIMGMVCAIFSYAQTTITVGTGTSTTTNAPITAYYGYSYTQMIYHADEIYAAGGDVGNISTIRFYYNSGPNQNSNSWTVYIGHTTNNTFAGNTDWRPLASMTQVFSGTVTFPAAGNWVDVTLTTPFLWNGMDNLVIAVDENQPSYASSNMNWNNTTTAGNNRVIYYRNDGTNPNPASPPTATGMLSSFPNVQLDITFLECAGMPSHSNTLVSDNTICAGQQVIFSLDNYNIFAGIQYTWQYDDGGGWTNFAGPAGHNLTTTLPQTTDVRAIVTCTNSGQSDTSGMVTVVVNPSPVVSITPTSYAICSGGSALLTASGANTYAWLPVTSLDVTDSAVVTSTPASSISYTVTGTDLLGCTNTATIPLTMLAAVNGDASVTPNQVCQPGIPVDITVSGLPAAISGSGTYEYRWLAEDGTTVLQNWGPSDTYNFTPAVDNQYVVFYQIRSTSCPSEVVDSIPVSFDIGFGADVAIQDYNCVHPEGIFTLDNIFGQYQTNILYTNAFDSIGALTFTGPASLNSGRAQITPSATGVSGTMLLNYNPVVLGLNNSMHVSFLLTADMPINNFGTGGGDGLTYSFGDDALSSSPGPAQNGKGTKLRLCFDAANNGTENGNATGIYLVYGWAGTNAYGPASGAVLAYSPNTSLWKLGTDVPVSLDISTEGKVTVTVNGTVVISDIQLPASYMSADVTNWNHLISAATGGDALRHAIDNFSISTSELAYGIVPGSTATPPASWQSSTIFDGLTPGDYTLWISNPADPSCRRNLGVFEINDLNPVVDLGNDTTICNGEILTLDAQNTGAAYLWSGSGDTTQTIQVSQEGTYGVSVTDTAGCMALGNMHVDIAPSPSADGIYASGMFPTVFLAVTNPIDATIYNWNFGDGNTQFNAPSTVGHVYAAMGVYTVTVTLSNIWGCDSVVVTKVINVNNTPLSLDENGLANLQVYPNPAQDFINIVLPSNDQVMVTVYTIAGAVVYKAPLTSSKVDVQELNNGVYFLKIEQGEKTAIAKIVVAH